MSLPRRTILRAAAPLVAFGAAGCMSTSEAIDEEGSIASETVGRTDDTSDTTETKDPWILHEGTLLVSVTVEEGFSGEVALEAACRAEAVTVAPGASVKLEREMDGESCPIRLSTGDEELYSEFVRGDQSFELTVRAGGEVEEQIGVI